MLRYLNMQIQGGLMQFLSNGSHTSEKCSSEQWAN